MRRALALAFAGTIALATFAPACEIGGDPRVQIVTRFTAPKALLDRATQLELTVLEGEVTCDGATGATEPPAGEAGAREIARSALGSSGCAPGVRFCGDVRIEKSDAVRVFSAAAKDASGTTVALGCTAATVDRDALPVAIQMFRYLEPAVCGDGSVQPTEQCEAAGSILCDDDCQSNEILLSVGSTQNNTATGSPKDKTDPFFLWPAGSGTTGRFLAFFTDRATGASNNTDVGIRAMGDDLAPLTTPPALANGSIFLPSGGAFPPQASPLRQSMPQAAFLGGKYWVVFQDDNSPSTFGLDIHLRSLNDVLQSDQGIEPLTINGAGASPTGEAGIQETPSIAAGASRLFVAWADAGGGKIAGRTLTPPATLGSQNDISTGNANSQPSVAAADDQFVIVWRSGTGIRFRKVNADGVPQGQDEAVSEGGGDFGRPQVAGLPDGRFAVAWTANGDVFVQRFRSDGARIAEDQAQPINDQVSDGDQVTATIAASPADGGSYVIAWVDAATGHVRARFLGGTAGFLFNNVNGQSTEFQASRADGRTRKNPAVAVGGSAPFVAIGWEDESSPNAGVIVRRFPLPAP